MMKLTALVCVVLVAIASSVLGADVERHNLNLGGPRGSRQIEERQLARPRAPTMRPRKRPTRKPTMHPRKPPTKRPTQVPSAAPSAMPSDDFCLGLARNGTHAYKVVHDKQYTWVESYFAALDLTCCGVRGHLATVADAAEQEFLYDLATAVTVQPWIGLNDILNEGSMVWVDRTPSVYLNFLPNEPSNTGDNEDCVFLTNLGGWSDYQCFAPWEGYIVEFDCE